MGARAEYRFLMLGIVLLCASGVASAISPTVEHVVGIVVVTVGAGAGLSCLVAAAVRRELRIRRRLAAIPPPPHPAPTPRGALHTGLREAAGGGSREPVQQQYRDIGQQR